ncbi:MAG: sulfurtransferase TusA family protein [Proteobacteria bacterium]|nr:sulfurtransferase TusA family protein [Pseudomonadota bacterium]MDE3208601.1 DUF2249 domain-containing protein [Pseudomonadota bacterium]
MNPNEAYITLDVREELSHGGEPLPRILEAISALIPNQGLRLFTTFEPKPLYALLKQHGFSHESRSLDRGEWEVLFTRQPTLKTNQPENNQKSTQAHHVPFETWPKPCLVLDNRNLLPPEPMVRILEALPALHSGDVLEALLDREPVFLYPELKTAGHEWHTQTKEPGATLIWIRVG